MPTPAQGYRVRLPGLSDIFHSIPDAARDPDELREIRQDRAALLADSPVPWLVLGAQDLLTRLDDIQDAAVTLSVLSRLAAPAIGALGPVAKASGIAADLLNLGTLARTRSLLTSTRKGSLFRAASQYRGSYTWRAKRALQGFPMLPTYGEILQIAQTTDQLLGVGLSLGPIMGVPADLLFTALYGGTIEIPTLDFAALAALAPTLLAANPWVRFGGMAAGFALSALMPTRPDTISIPVPRLLPLDEEDTATLVDHPSMLPSASALEWSADVLSSSPALDVLNQGASIEDHWTATVARFQALSILAPWLVAAQTRQAVREYFPLQLNARPLAARYTGTSAGQELRSVAAKPALAFPGNPQASPTLPYAAATMRGDIPGPLGWTLDHPDDPRAKAARALGHEAAGLLLAALVGPQYVEGPTPSPELLLALKIAEGSAPDPTPPPIRTAELPTTSTPAH